MGSCIFCRCCIAIEALFLISCLPCCRYKLLLTDLLKNTLPDDDDYAALTGMTLLAVFPLLILPCAHLGSPRQNPESRKMVVVVVAVVVMLIVS